MRNHEKLLVWKEGIKICNDIYRITRDFPKEERFGLSSQMRRAAISTVSNIAEGCYRSTKKEFRNFLFISRGSLAELDTQLKIAGDIGIVKQEEMKELREKTFSLIKMITALVGSLFQPKPTSAKGGSASGGKLLN